MSVMSIHPWFKRRIWLWEQYGMRVWSAIYSQTLLSAYRHWTDFLSVLDKNMTGATRVICVTAAFAACDHLLNEMISYVLAPLYSRVCVDENEHRLRFPCQRHIFYLKLPHILITKWSERVPQWLWCMRCTVSAPRMPEHIFSNQ